MRSKKQNGFRAGSKKASGFKKGSGCFPCEVCTRSTRDTGGDNAQVRLCAECYEVAGIENQIADRGDQDGSLRAEVNRLNEIIRSKGGVL